MNYQLKKKLITLGIVGVLSILGLATKHFNKEGGGNSSQTFAPDPYSTTQNGAASGSTINFWMGEPVQFENQEKTVRVLHNPGHVNGYCVKRLNPVWTGYILNHIEKPISSERPGDFYPDNRMPPKYQVDTREYTHSGYDRGHMAPNWAISTNYGRKAQVDTFFTTNICPQAPDLNRTLWQTLEKLEANYYPKKYGPITSFCGPIFLRNKKPEIIGKNLQIHVPDGFYKILVRNDGDTPQVLAFIIPQTATGNQANDLAQYLGTVDQIERETQLDFLPKIEKALQEELESTQAPRLWK